ncbi:MAG: UDP-N-acetylmuramoyl-tripeptide--D-alanyl-D-alanine ligase [Myxococcota bacterium]
MSVPFTAAEVRTWTGAQLLQGDASRSLSGASIDTRTVEAGQLFVAIAGPNHDAHRYLGQALEAGAGGLLIETGRTLPADLAGALPVLAVDDTIRGLGQLGAGHRAGFDGPVVGITGSNGKTTCKEMCAAVLEVGAPTLKNRGNLNNNFGLPLTLLSREPEHQRLVVELGMNHRGEIAELAAIARPGIGAVTNVGTAHIEYLGSRDAIAAEEGDLLAALPAGGTAVVPGDDDYADTLAGRTVAPVLRFGRGAGNDVCAEGVRALDASGFAFELKTPRGGTAVEIAGLGDPTIHNALCAATAALAAGASLEEIALGLGRYRPVGGRLQRRDLPSGVVVIDDSSNANPQSLEVALRLLARSGNGRRVAVIGDMGELGDAAEAAHREAGALAARLGIDFLVAAGREAERVASGATGAGMDPTHVRVVESSEAAGPPVQEIVKRGDWVLVKGSRSMKMERVAEYLEAEARP